MAEQTRESTFSLLGIPIANITMETALGRILAAADAWNRDDPTTEMAFVNAHCINVAARDDTYREIVSGQSAVFADGSGIRKAGDMLGVPIVDNVNGTDMFPLLCSACAEAGKTLYLLGGRPGIAEKSAAWADAHAGTAVVAGFHHGYLDSSSEQLVLQQIRELRPDILLVAMGVPMQELWIHAHREELAVPVSIGVGGLFDFYSGRIARAPGFLRRVGLEWAWRLLMEPRRMWKRYLVGNVVFMVRIWKIRRRGMRK